MAILFNKKWFPDENSFTVQWFIKIFCTHMLQNKIRVRLFVQTSFSHFLLQTTWLSLWVVLFRCFCMITVLFFIIIFLPTYKCLHSSVTVLCGGISHFSDGSTFIVVVVQQKNTVEGDIWMVGVRARMWRFCTYLRCPHDNSE